MLGWVRVVVVCVGVRIGGTVYALFRYKLRILFENPTNCFVALNIKVMFALNSSDMVIHYDLIEM